MNLRSFLILLIILTASAHAQETISEQPINEEQITEEQIILNGYVDLSYNVAYADSSHINSIYSAF